MMRFAYLGHWILGNNTKSFTGTSLSSLMVQKTHIEAKLQKMFVVQYWSLGRERMGWQSIGQNKNKKGGYVKCTRGGPRMDQSGLLRHPRYVEFYLSQ
jgi:hypothetical protein